MFSDDQDSLVNEIDISFMHPKQDNLWDWPKKADEKRVRSAFVFYGPTLPDAPTKKGFRFPDEDDARKQYKIYKKEKGNLI